MYDSCSIFMLEIFLNENLNSPVKLVVSGVSAQLLMRKQEHQVPLSVD